MKRVLITDDSRFLRERLKQILTPLGWDFAEAANGVEALERLAESSFQLMLLDVNMPEMNGLECVRQLRERALAPAMKVMMVTTEVDSSFILQALDYGADEFLMKPFTPDSLLTKLRMLGLADAGSHEAGGFERRRAFPVAS